MKCSNGCDVEIYLDWSVRSESGKQIPLEVETGLPHNCPNKKQYSEKFIGEEINELEKKENEYYPKY